jgi:hypothetical protein
MNRRQHQPAMHCTCGAAHPARRAFLRSGLALAAAAAAPALWAQSGAQRGTQGRPAIRSLRGLVRVNGERAGASAPIRPGDTIATGSDGRVSFVVGGDAYFLRENSELKIESSAAGALIDSLRMVTGALGAVFARRQSGQVALHTPTVTAGIRGTGCYTEVRDEGVYFCTCFGAIQLTSEHGGQQELVVSSHHDPRLIMRNERDGKTIMTSTFGQHTDQEMDALERLVGRRAPWAT